MPRTLALGILIVASATLACTTGASTAPPDYVEFIIGEDGVGGIVIAPEHAQVETDGEAVRITANEGFAITLTRGLLNLQDEQARVIDENLQLQEFVTHTDTTLIWRWGPTDAGKWFHFAHVGAIEGQPYYCRSEPNHRFSLDDVEVMLEACESVTFTGDSPNDTPTPNAS